MLLSCQIHQLNPILLKMHRLLHGTMVEATKEEEAGKCQSRESSDLVTQSTGALLNGAAGKNIRAPDSVSANPPHSLPPHANDCSESLCSRSSVK